MSKSKDKATAEQKRDQIEHNKLVSMSLQSGEEAGGRLCEMIQLSVVRVKQPQI